jgi:hypothetical protein
MEMKSLEGKVVLVTGAARGISAVIAERLATGAPLAEVAWETVYGSGPRGYFGYPSGGGRVNSTRGANARPSD